MTYLERISVFLLLTASCSLLANEEEVAHIGGELFRYHCSNCHDFQSASFDGLIAPLVTEIRNEYLGRYEDKNAFVNAMVSWLKDPSESRSVMPGAVARYGIMPPLQIDGNTAKAIATFFYYYNGSPPEWYIADFLKHNSGQNPEHTSSYALEDPNH